MKWVAALLMILNVVIFLRVSDRQVENGFQRSDARPDVNRESMLLLKEVYAEASQNTPDTDPVVQNSFGDPALPNAIFDGRDAALIGNQEVAQAGSELESMVIDNTDSSDQDDGQKTSSTTLLPVVIDSELVTATPTAETQGEPDWSCYRVGPFKDQTVWQQARQWGNLKNLDFVPVRSESRELRAVRVYIGPFASISAAQPDVELLKAKELDHFVYLRNDDQARVSLGYFTQEELANKFVEYLVTQDIPAKSQPEYRTMGPFDWMDVKIDSADRGDLLSKQWGADSVIVAERECPDSSS